MSRPQFHHSFFLFAGWLVVAAALLFTPGCGTDEKPAPEKPSDEVPIVTSGVTPEARELWERTFTRGITDRDPARLDSLIDWDAVTDIALGDLGLTETVQAEWSRTILKPFRAEGMLREICTATAQHDEYRFLEPIDPSVPVATARFASQDGTSLDYQEWTLTVDDDGVVRATDLFNFSSGETLTRTLRRTALVLLANRHPDLITGLTGWERDFAIHQREINAMLSAADAGESIEVADRYLALPKTLRTDRTFAFVYLRSLAAAERFLTLTEGLSTDRPGAAYAAYDELPRSREKSPGELQQYRDELLAKNLPDYRSQVTRLRESVARPEEIDFLSLTGFYTLDDTASALDVLDRLNRYFEGDPQVLTMQARLLADHDRVAEARTHAERALHIDPDWPSAYWVLIECSLKDRAPKETVHWLNELERRAPESTLNLESLPEFQQFRQTPAYQAWQTARRPLGDRRRG